MQGGNRCTWQVDNGALLGEEKRGIEVSENGGLLNVFLNDYSILVIASYDENYDSSHLYKSNSYF